MTIRLGACGWVYKHWRGIFYPEALRQKEWFGYYAREFDTVEINNTFYRLPAPETFDAWRQQAPRGFLYAVKASRFLTHLKRLKDPEEPLRRLFEGAGRLGPVLGPVLYQLPPNFQCDLGRFEHFLSVLPQGYTHVVEFRNSSWLDESVFQLMEHFGVSHCIHDMGRLEVPIRITASPAYVRLHGGHVGTGGYERGSLEAWARHITSWNDQGLDVFVYFNNDIGGFAVRDARALKGILGIT